MMFEHPAGDAVVVGNYRTSGIDMIPGFTHTGMWYDYLTGDSLNVTDLNASMPFAPGELHVYTDTPLDLPVLTEIDVDLDGQLASEGDCNDNDATIYTGAVDIANDGIDQDCDGLDATVGVEEALSGWSLFPNPATDVLLHLTHVHGIVPQERETHLPGRTKHSHRPKHGRRGNVAAQRGSPRAGHVPLVLDARRDDVIHTCAQNRALTAQGSVYI